MSKIGQKPIAIPKDTEVKLQDGVFEVKGKRGSLKINVLPHVSANIKDDNIQLNITVNNAQARSNWGTMGALLKNAVIGTNEGFTKILEIKGVGFRASMDGNNLVLNVGFSHSVKFTTPEGIKITVEKSLIKVEGINKELVGEVAANIRKIKKPEPYKGKGIMYQGEIIRRKSGKKVAGTGTGAA